MRSRVSRKAHRDVNKRHTYEKEQISPSRKPRTGLAALIKVFFAASFQKFCVKRKSKT